MFQSYKELNDYSDPNSHSGVRTARKQQVSKFIEKTFRLLKVYRLSLEFLIQNEQENSLSNIISWNHNGSVFVIKRPQEFAEEVLSKYFGHKNLSSFTRQVSPLKFFSYLDSSICMISEGKLAKETNVRSLTLYLGRPAGYYKLSSCLEKCLLIMQLEAARVDAKEEKASEEMCRSKF